MALARGPTPIVDDLSSPAKLREWSRRRRLRRVIRIRRSVRPWRGRAAHRSWRRSRRRTVSRLWSSTTRRVRRAHRRECNRRIHLHVVSREDPWRRCPMGLRLGRSHLDSLRSSRHSAPDRVIGRRSGHTRPSSGPHRGASVGSRGCRLHQPVPPWRGSVWAHLAASASAARLRASACTPSTGTPRRAAGPSRPCQRGRTAARASGCAWGRTAPR
jgi:hypothetical protein